MLASIQDAHVDASPIVIGEGLRYRRIHGIEGASVDPEAHVMMHSGGERTPQKNIFVTLRVANHQTTFLEQLNKGKLIATR